MNSEPANPMRSLSALKKLVIGEINVRRAMQSVMVGNLYPSILENEIEVLQRILQQFPFDKESL